MAITGDFVQRRVCLGPCACSGACMGLAPLNFVRPVIQQVPAELDQRYLQIARQWWQHRRLHDTLDEAHG